MLAQRPRGTGVRGGGTRSFWTTVTSPESVRGDDAVWDHNHQQDPVTRLCIACFFIIDGGLLIRLLVAKEILEIYLLSLVLSKMTEERIVRCSVVKLQLE